MSMIDAVRRRSGAELAVDTRGLVTFWLAFADLVSPLLILASITDGVEAERSGVARDKVRETSVRRIDYMATTHRTTGFAAE